MATRVLALRQTRALMTLLAFLSAALSVGTILADGQDAKSSSAARTLTQRAPVCLRHWNDRPFDTLQQTFLITHGMGGTESGDRFHQLADAIHKAYPESNVMLIDWSKESWQTTGYRPFADASSVWGAIH